MPCSVQRYIPAWESRPAACSIKIPAGIYFLQCAGALSQPGKPSCSLQEAIPK